MAVTPGELVDAAVTSGLISADLAAQVRAEVRRRGDLLEAISTRGRLPVSSLYRALAEVRGLAFIDLSATPPQADLVRRFPEALLRRGQMVPVSRNGESVLVATSDPDDHQTPAAVERILGLRAQIAVADPESLRLALRRMVAAADPETGAPAMASSAALDPVGLLDRILKEAYLRRASDVHLEPQTGGMRVRLRIDGRLQVYVTGIDTPTGASLLSRVKVMADLDIAEQRAPQDGRFSYQPPGQGDTWIDIRVATAPTRWGERATLRLLGSETTELTLESLGMSQRDLSEFRRLLRRPHGIVLLTGPTGSGKTTTLYAALREINQTHLNILTVEDPVEYVIPGVNQVHVNWTDKVTFGSALRALLRHDPDVLMVGEIRDFETADVALKAAMTGHLILSTLHTNNACGAVTRLVDLGCEPYLVASTLAAVIAQRLVRRLCPRCKLARPASADDVALLGVEGRDVELFEPVGCASCLGTGYRGRIGLFEPVWVSRQLSELISHEATQGELEAHLADSLTTLRGDGFAKVLQGVTSLDEVLQATLLEV